MFALVNELVYYVPVLEITTSFVVPSVLLFLTPGVHTFFADIGLFFVLHHLYFDFKETCSAYYCGCELIWEEKVYVERFYYKRQGKVCSKFGLRR